MVEHYLDMVGVAGSRPAVPTKLKSLASIHLLGYFFASLRSEELREASLLKFRKASGGELLTRINT